MARIKSLVLPPRLTDVLVSAIEELPEDFLLTWGRDFLPGGFTKLESIRERMAARFRSDAALDTTLLSLLAHALPFRETIEAFSLAALQQLYEPLAIVLGQEELLLVLLVDPRDQVHRWAAEQALKPAPSPPTNADVAVAEDFLLQFASDKLLHLVPLDSPPPPPGGFPGPPAGDPPPIDKFLESAAGKALKQMEEQVESQRKTIERLNRELQHQKQRHLAKLREESDAADREKKGIRAQLATAQAQLASLQKENLALETRLKELAERIDAAVAQGLKEHASALVRKWLAEPLETEAAVKEVEPRSGNLLERAEHALAAQAQQDRHTGNRLELERKLGTLQTLQERVAAALRTALFPLPALKPLLADIDSEIARLRNLLQGARPVSELAARLLVSVNTAASWEEVRGCSQSVEQLVERGLLPSEDLRGVYNAIQRKFSLLEETGRTRNVEGDSGWSLRDTLYRNKNALLLLDGHNLLFGLKDIFSPDYEEGFPRRKARQRLIDLVAKLVRNRANVSTKICFDGPDGTTTRLAPNLEVVYSGGTSQNRADELIVSHLQFKDLKSLDQKVFVVTDDREVRRGILQTGAKFVPGELFAVFLNDFGCLGA